MERRSERSDSPRSETIVDARASLALWLRAGRSHRGMSLDDVARVTKIQPRILERLEAGKFDGLPAEVFVRGFVRSFARCVGLDEAEALRRYSACGLGIADSSGPSDLAPTVRALVEAMVDLAPGSAMAPRATPRKMQVVEVNDPTNDPTGEDPTGEDLATEQVRDRPASGAIVEMVMLPETGTVVIPAPSPASDTIAAPARPAAMISLAASPDGPAKKKRGRRAKGRNNRFTGSAAPDFPRELRAVGTPAGASPIVTELVVPADAPGTPARLGGHDAGGPDLPAMPEIPGMADALEVDEARDGMSSVDGVSLVSVPSSDEPSTTWAPKMPPIAATPSVPWRKPAYAGATAASAAVAVPSLVIDDADPDSAERILEERAEKQAPRRSFLPPILLDREDRSARQGGLTLAVILLLIAATLTLSYLMRRPSAGGDGMTRRETPAVDSAAPTWDSSTRGSLARG